MEQILFQKGPMFPALHNTLPGNMRENVDAVSEASARKKFGEVVNLK